MKLTTSLFLLLTASAPQAAELVKSCDIGARLAIIKDSRIADTHIYYLQDGKTRSPVFGDPDQSRGSAIQAACVGKKVRALVVSGEFTANALQGFVITHRPGSATPERLDFAEKSRPEWLYLSPHEVIAVIPTWGYGETSAKYVAYHRIVGETGADRVDAIDRLPSSRGFEVVNMRSSKD